MCGFSYNLRQSTTLCQTTGYIINIFQENPSKHPIIILKDVPFSHLQSILEFMYAGEVNVSQEQLPAFLKTADRLKVKGLAEAPQGIKREGQFQRLMHLSFLNVFVLFNVTDFSPFWFSMTKLWRNNITLIYCC